MLAVIYALVAAVVVGVGCAFVPFIGPIAAPLPALAVAVGVYFLLVKRINTRVQAEMAALQSLLMNKNVDGAFALLEAIKAKYGRWVFLLSAQVDGQIGSIHYLRNEFDKARPYLERCFIRLWDAKLMLACLMSGVVGGKKAKGASGKDGKPPEVDLKEVDTLLTRVVKYTPKQGLLYSTWAWLHWNAGDNKRALEILAKGKDVLGDADPHLAANLLAVQNEKKMKMKGYGQPWYALQLEQHPVVMQQQRGGNVRFARR